MAQFDWHNTSIHFRYCIINNKRPHREQHRAQNWAICIEFYLCNTVLWYHWIERWYCTLLFRKPQLRNIKVDSVHSQRCATPLTIKHGMIQYSTVQHSIKLPENPNNEKKEKLKKWIDSCSCHHVFCWMRDAERILGNTVLYEQLLFT